jgi:CRISPR-associated protein Cmr3
VDELKAGSGATADPVTARRLRLLGAERLGGVRSSLDLPYLLAAQGEADKPAGGYWLIGEGLERYLAGELPLPEHLVHRRRLWATDPRLGIARSRTSFTAEVGKIYTTETVALADGVGFLLGVDGCDGHEALVPGSGLLRLGGDGRGAEVSPWGEVRVATESLAPANEPFTVVLTTPGLFPGGWLPPGVGHRDGAYRLEVDGLRARLAAAAVPRAEVVSGWDLAAHRPKPAQRAVPAGAVYYFDEVEGDPSAYRERLWALAETELGTRWDTAWKQRRAEGFDNVVIGRWPGGEP